MYIAWACVLGHEFDRRLRDTDLRHRTLIE
jgi:hypothetical protein